MILWRIKDIGQYHAIVQDAPSVRKRNLVVASLHITLCYKLMQQGGGWQTHHRAAGGREGEMQTAKKLLTISKLGSAVPEGVIKQGGSFTLPAGVPG